MDHPPIQEPAPDTSTSMMSRLRKLREEISLDKPLDVPVPGYQDQLFIRFKRVSWDEVRDVAERSFKSRDKRKELWGQCDLIIRCTDQLLVRHPSDDHITPIDEVTPVTWSKETAQDFFNFEAKSARECVRGVFKNDMAISSVANELTEWLQDTASEADEDFVGN